MNLKAKEAALPKQEQDGEKALRPHSGGKKARRGNILFLALIAAILAAGIASMAVLQYWLPSLYKNNLRTAEASPNTGAVLDMAGDETLTFYPWTKYSSQNSISFDALYEQSVHDSAAMRSKEEISGTIDDLIWTGVSQFGPTLSLKKAEGVANSMRFDSVTNIWYLSKFPMKGSQFTGDYWIDASMWNMSFLSFHMYRQDKTADNTDKTSATEKLQRELQAFQALYQNYLASMDWTLASCEEFLFYQTGAYQAGEDISAWMKLLNTLYDLSDYNTIYRPEQYSEFDYHLCDGALGLMGAGEYNIVSYEGELLILFTLPVQESQADVGGTVPQEQETDETSVAWPEQAAKVVSETVSSFYLPGDGRLAGMLFYYSLEDQCFTGFSYLSE